MANPSISVPEELLTEIDKQRARNATENGKVKSRSEWFREAAREKLGIDYTDEPPAGEGAA